MNVFRPLGSLLAGGALALTLSVSSPLRAQADAPPAAAAAPHNIVVILSDDVGYGDLPSYGATQLATPNIDRIAHDGIRFTDFHATSAVCTPTRYSLLTGRYAFRHPKAKGILSGVDGSTIPAGSPTIASMLHSAGYTTGIVGKWHLGLGVAPTDYNHPVHPGPNDMGFDYSFIYPATNDRVPCVYLENDSVVNYDPADPITVSYGPKVGADPTGKEDPGLLKFPPVPGHGHDGTIVDGVSRIGFMSGGTKARWKDEEMADTITHKAVDFIERSRDKRFFLLVTTNDIHVPQIPNPRYVGKTKAGTRGEVLEELDGVVGAVEKELDARGLTKDTLFIFTSDNGGIENDGYNPPNPDLGGLKPNGDLRGHKAMIYEGGHRVPFMAQWPGHIKPGTTSAALFATVDLPSSLAAIVGQPVAGDAFPDSFDESAAILGKSPTGRADLVYHAGGNGALALRRGKWVLIPRPARSGNELYDLDADPSQKTDVAEQHPEIIAEMAPLLEKYRAAAATRPGAR